MLGWTDLTRPSDAIPYLHSTGLDREGHGGLRDSETKTYTATLLRKGFHGHHATRYFSARW
jgi:hypothetical protein